MTVQPVPPTAGPGSYILIILGVVIVGGGAVLFLLLVRKKYCKKRPLPGPLQPAATQQPPEFTTIPDDPN